MEDPNDKSAVHQWSAVHDVEVGIEEDIGKGS
jgi:hypothetical protein